STEFVDVEFSSEDEGPTLGWIEAGEWLEYSITVSEPAYYDLSYRFSSGNSSSSGGFYFEINGIKVSEDIYPGVSGDWNNWLSGSTGNIELNAGDHTLRLVLLEGGFNLGRMTFAYNRPLGYHPPRSNAGDDKIVIFPSNHSILSGELSTDLDTDQLSYFWSQIYGPSVANISGQSTVSAFVDDLVEGVYKFKLFVSDGSHSSIDFMYVFVSSSEGFYPSISLITSSLNSTYHFGSQIEIEVSAADIDGSIELIEFYDNDEKIGEIYSEPYKFLWENISIGNHSIKAVATDNDGLSNTSNSFEIEIIEAALCTGGPDNGDYAYELSDDLNNPTITFIPNQNNTGNPTCILYYAQSGTPPGYNVIPNQPFQLYANEGETIQFYYTYSFNGLEKNTSANPHSYEIGSCSNENLSTNKAPMPTRFSLKQNYPNPFNPSTKIQYELPKETFVIINIFDLKGAKIMSLVNSKQSAGFKEISWNGLNSLGSPLPAGLYFLTIQTKEYFNSKKMILLQ
ncbi:MAG: carbohydrate-binding protein, partial [Candidatus Marinimicrobia bacterium]|nr:carbohydrate-binding protein [Candidatus Neomarinimicrobiota bacterium]